jgi:hypothetical protein
MTFINEVQKIATEKADILSKEKSNNNIQRQIEVRSQLMNTITGIYYHKLKSSITRRSNYGKRELYFNFNYEDFKANCNGLGKPAVIQDMWLKEMSNPSSEFLPLKSKINDEDPDEKEDSFEGLVWQIWGNKTFTTVFTW